MNPPTTFTEAEERLAESLPGYESRPQQQALAKAVEDAVRHNHHLLAEAGTGTGKSLGYLIPSILSGRRVIVSTATKALQDQVAYKDLPFLAANLGVDFSYAILKGRSNYLCVNKLESADPADLPSAGRLLRFVNAEMAKADSTFTGEREDLPFEIETREWMQVAADSDDCGAFNCKKNLNCYAERAKDRAKMANVAVVNHSLYVSDLQVRVFTYGNADLIGPHEVVIFDEAHELEEYAGNALGFQITEGSVRTLVIQVENFIRRNAAGFPQGDLSAAVGTLQAATSDLFGVLEVGRIRQAEIVEHADEFVGLTNALIDFHAQVASINEYLDRGASEKITARAEALERRTLNLAKRSESVIKGSFDELVRWVEEDRDRKVLRGAPIDVAPWLRQHLFGTRVTAILTSATLTTTSGFGYIAGRLGVDEYEDLDVGTPFDYPRQARLYVPKHLPDPSRERVAWSSGSISEMLELVQASEGRALLLFTSITEMKAAYNAISSRVPYTCMMQGQQSNKVLAERFKEDTHSVLFATRSFMTGVDFQGETLSLVVINKLPFPVPTEPLTQARCESIKRHGGNDFVEYTVPVMSLILKQAFGRLIRHRDDRGVVAILDPRLETKGYGKNIVRSLPDAPVVYTVPEVEDLYENGVPA